jgi:hypothetical protein
METPQTRTAVRELAHRQTDGIVVRLLWESGADRLTVSVSDERSGDVFELDAEPEGALEVFEHPYAYAAFTGVRIHAHGSPEPRSHGRRDDQLPRGRHFSARFFLVPASATVYVDSPLSIIRRPRITR